MSEMNMIWLRKLCDDKPSLLHQLQDWNLIPRRMKCNKCGGRLVLHADASRIDGWIWRCLNRISKRKQKVKICGNMVSFRTGTFFARSKLSIFKVLSFVTLWVENAMLLLIQKRLGMSNHTCVDWSYFCREVMLTHFIDKKTKLGGPGLTVEIHESKFGKRKNHKGHQIDCQWVFGGYELGTGRIFMVPVENRGADPLIPLIEQWIQPGTTIVSDYWRVYGCLDRHDYIDLKVNHSVTYKNPYTIESSRRAAKGITTSSGRNKAPTPGDLARNIFEKKCTELKLHRTEEFLRLAGEVYDASRPAPEEEEDDASCPVPEEEEDSDMNIDIDENEIKYELVDEIVKEEPEHNYSKTIEYSKADKQYEDETEHEQKPEIFKKENINNSSYNAAQEEIVIKEEVVDENEIKFELFDEIVKEEPEDNYSTTMEHCYEMRPINNSSNNAAQVEIVIKEEVVDENEIKFELFGEIMKEEPEDNYSTTMEHCYEMRPINNSSDNAAQVEIVIKEEVVDENEIKFELFGEIVKEEPEDNYSTTMEHCYEMRPINNNSSDNAAQVEIVIKEEVVDENEMKFELFGEIVKEEPEDNYSTTMEHCCEIRPIDNSSDNAAQLEIVIEEEVVDENEIKFELFGEIVKEEPEDNYSDIMDMKSENVEFFNESDNNEESTSKVGPQPFATQSDLSDNEQSDDSDGLFECSVCNKKFKQKYVFKAHMCIHTEENPYKCDICDKAFNRNASLVRHKRCHAGERPFKCDICDKAFSTSSIMARHKRRHTSENPYICYICDKAFNTKGNLKTHILSHAYKNV